MANYKEKMGIYDKDDPANFRQDSARKRNPSDKYGSIREFGTEERLKQNKRNALKNTARGLAVAPASIAASALADELPQSTGPSGGVIDYISSRHRAISKAVKDASGGVRDAAKKYTAAKEEEAALDRELESQKRRETRGMKGGGAVRGWGKARGARKAKMY